MIGSRRETIVRQGRSGRGGGNVQRTAAAQAGTEFGPAIREARQQAKGSVKRQKDIGQWYGQLAHDYAASQRQGNAAFKTAEQATSQQLSEAGARGQSEAGEIAAKNSALASLIHGPADTAGLTQVAQAGAAAARSRAALEAPIATTQASYLANLGGRRTAARMKGIEARKEEGERRDKILSDLAAARKEKGQATVSNVGKLREANRSFRTTQEELAQKKREAAVSEAQSAASLAASQRSAGISARQAQERIGIERKSARTTAQHYKHETSASGLTASEQQKLREGHANATATAQSLFEAKKWPSYAALERAVAKESEVSPSQARTAVAAIKGHVEGQQRKQATKALRSVHR